MAKPTWNFGTLRVDETGRLDKHGRPIKRLALPFSVSSGFNGNGIMIEVPEGFETNYASTPRFTWRLFPPDGLYNKATVVHDYHYARQVGISRFLADAIFRDHMAALGVPRWQRCAMYYAVRLFSWRHWR